MKVSVVGAGAIGSMFGGLVKQHLTQAQVVLIARGGHGEAMRRQGFVALHGPWGVHRPAIEATDDLSAISGSDHVLFSVKSQDTETVIRACQPFLGDAVVTSIQNGINHHILADFVAPDRLVMGTTVTNMAAPRPGTVTLQINGVTAVGPCPGYSGSAAAEQSAQLLSATGLPIELHQQILGLQYNKLVINCLGCASAISNLNFVREGIFHREWRHAVAWPILNECLAVYERAGIPLGFIRASSDVTRFSKLMRSLDRPLRNWAIRLIERMIVRRKPTKFSVRQDLDRGRPTEVDFINGEVVRLATEHGMIARYNSLVTSLVHELEERPLADRVMGRDPVIRRFREAPAPTLVAV